MAAARLPSNLLSPCRRAYSISHEHHHRLRELLRETAQPVAVVTSLMPRSNASDASDEPLYHGATLSSFTSISLSPYPLVAFSLRVPSRMATTLSHLSQPRTSSSSSDAASLSNTHMVVNILSAAQTHAAHLFSRTDLYPRPFDSSELSFSFTRDRLPILHGSLGALSCRVIGTAWPLSDLKALGGSELEGDDEAGDGVASELFIAKVVRVEDVPVETKEDDPMRTLPLLYHRRGYGTIAPHSSFPKS
ncbi:flavin reductase like domain-containing protein [Amylostereum chailletii]|nr:flavin reductase like domain-containing protein [Amylostereum chailletii]